MVAQPLAFSITFVALFALSFAFLAAVDALPEPTDAPVYQDGTETPAVADTTPAYTAPADAEVPLRVVARSIGLDAPVANPATTDIEALDQELLHSTVRYPTSAMLGVEGTVLLFGHSSYLPVVRNQAYKFFNDVQFLHKGDIVSVYSGTAEYRYAVTSVRLANATEDVVEMPSDGKYLTLVTCDTFGSKSNRFVVETEFVGSYPL